MASADQKLKSDLQKKAADNSVDEEFKVAQSLDENELNNLSTLPNLESYLQMKMLRKALVPTESIPINNEQLPVNNDNEQFINADDLKDKRLMQFHKKVLVIMKL